VTAPILDWGKTQSEEYNKNYEYKDAKSGQENRLEESKNQTVERNQTNTDGLDFTKQRKNKNIKKMKSVKMKFENMFTDSRILLDLLELNGTCGFLVFSWVDQIIFLCFAADYQSI
jgi:hypothetical protein